MRIDTSTFSPDHPERSTNAPIPSLQLYNALDCCMTFEIWQRLQDLRPGLIYGFERALQGPALEMMLRGWKVDQYERRKAIEMLEARQTKLLSALDRMARAVWDKPLNARSPKQLQEFFYGAMHIPEIWSSKKGERKLSMDRDALDKIGDYFHARPIVATIQAIRDTAKKLEVLTTEIDPDGRMRTSINVGATETGRLSSSTSTTGTGTNLQNITEELRRIFVADPGWKLCAIDAEQSESRDVGWLCGTILGDWTYLDACESGDLHTQVTRMVWPEFAWTGDPKSDRKIAEQIFYRHFTYRDGSKRLGHGSNYLGTPATMSKHTKIPIKLVSLFQDRYFERFHCITEWHRWTAEQLQTKQLLITPFGRQRHFFGNPSDDATLREAVAFVPQSMTVDRVNLGMWRIWHKMPEVRIMLQLHDAVYFQYRETDDEVEIVNKALDLMRVELRHGNRIGVVPGEPKVGWNWGNVSESNPDGLAKFRGRDTRRRTPLLERAL